VKYNWIQKADGINSVESSTAALEHCGNAAMQQCSNAALPAVK